MRRYRGRRTLDASRHLTKARNEAPIGHVNMFSQIPFLPHPPPGPPLPRRGDPRRAAAVPPARGANPAPQAPPRRLHLCRMDAMVTGRRGRHAQAGRGGVRPRHRVRARRLRRDHHPVRRRRGRCRRGHQHRRDPGGGVRGRGGGRAARRELQRRQRRDHAAPRRGQRPARQDAGPGRILREPLPARPLSRAGEHPVRCRQVGEHRQFRHRRQLRRAPPAASTGR